MGDSRSPSILEVLDAIKVFYGFSDKASEREKRT